TEEMLEYMARFDKLPGMPKTRHITGARYLEENFTPEAPLAVWDGELYLEMHRGTFTTKADLKKHNRLLENKLRDAELLCSLVYARGGGYPEERLRELYKLLLVNQFHDILPGSHIAPVYRDAMADYARLHDELDEIIARAMAKLGLPCVNTLPWERSPRPAGNPLCERGADWFSFSESTLQTPLYHVKFGEGGEILSLYDLNLQREWVKPGGAFNRVTLYNDTPGNYDAWDILPDYKSIAHALEVAAPLSLEKRDGDSLTLAAEYKTEKSRWVQKIRFFRASSLIDIENIVSWREDNRLAKALFDVNVLARTALCDTSAGVCLRETHRNTTWQQARYEVCAHKFSDMSEGGAGVALLNNCKYGISLEGSAMGLSLLRATQRPDVFADRGGHTFSYAIFPHGEGTSIADITKLAWEYNIPLLGEGTPAQPFSIDRGNVFLQAVKKAEDGDTLVLRLCEQAGRRGRAALKLPFKIQSARALDLLERPCEGDVAVIAGDALAFAYQPFEIITLEVGLAETK
ncbi:MAG: glycosyl hydrolase-related protein, partial [Firmicutes bacterium]|nr:glycosyl hydrolase-related protein [Bacillota bacterium]